MSKQSPRGAFTEAAGYASPCGRVTLYCGDSHEMLPSLTGFDAVISDPPYGIAWNTDYTRFTSGMNVERTNHKRIANDEKPFDPRPWMLKMPVVLFGANCFTEHLTVGSWLVWDKRFANGKAFLADGEVAWMNRGHGVYIYSETAQGFVRKEPVEHPTQKPVGVMEWCMAKAKVPAGATVLDPFMGSGTTGIACIRTGRKFIGIEKDPAHFATAVERIKRELAQGDLFEKHNHKLMDGGPPIIESTNGAARRSMQRLVREFVDARLADCMDVMAEYPDGHFDLAIVDPPYGIGAGGSFGRYWDSTLGKPAPAAVRNIAKDWDKAIPGPDYWRELFRVSKHQIVWGANYFTEHLPPRRGWIGWDKKQPEAASFGMLEMAWSNFDRPTKMFRMYSTHVTQGVRIHPTQKPVKLYDWLLANYAKPDWRILDTHMGSGSIAIACHNARLPLVACEIDPDYFEAACERIERETAQATFYLPNDKLTARVSGKDSDV